MRTTLSLDDDVAAELRRIQKATGRSWKDVVNETLRLGFRAGEGNRERRVLRRTKPVSLGAPLLGDISNVHEVLSLVEGDDRA
jgi:hypothetical protein